MKGGDLLENIVAIDIPNIFAGMKRKFRDDVKYWRDIDWQILSQEIAGHIPENESFVFAGAYAKDTKGAQHHKQELINAGFEPRIRGGKDIDAWIVTDLNKKVMEMLDLVLFKDRYVSGPMPDGIRIFLVSGDGVYRHTIRSLKYLFPDLKIELIVMSWAASCNKRLRDVADRILYLDDIPGLTKT